MAARERNSNDYPKPKEDVYVLWVEGISQQYRWQEFKDRVRECRPKPDKIAVRQSAVHEPNPGCGQVTIPNKEQALFAYEHLCTHGWNRQNIKVSLFGVRGGEIEKPKLLKGPAHCGPNSRNLNGSITSNQGRATVSAIPSISSVHPGSTLRPPYPTLNTSMYPTQIAYTSAPLLSPIEASAPIYQLTSPTSPTTFNPLLPSPTSNPYTIQYHPQYPIAAFSEPATTMPPPQEPRASRTVFLSNVPKSATFQSVKDYIRTCTRNASPTVHVESVDIHSSRGYASVICASREQGELVIRLVAGRRWSGKVIQARFERSKSARPKPADVNPTGTKEPGRGGSKKGSGGERREGVPLIVDGSRGAGSSDNKDDDDDDDDDDQDTDGEEDDIETVTHKVSKTAITRKGRR